MCTDDSGINEFSQRLRLQPRYKLPELSSTKLWSKLMTHVHCRERLPETSCSAWPFHSWFELQRLQFENRLNKHRFRRLQARSVREHPSDPLEQKKQLFDALCFSGATKNYATAPDEQKDLALKSLPVDQVLHYRAHLKPHQVRSGDGSLSHKDIQLTLKEPLWTGNRRLFRKFGSDRFLHVTFDDRLLSCGSYGGCKVHVGTDAEVNSPVGHGCKQCRSLTDYLALQLVGNASEGESTHVVLSLAGASLTRVVVIDSITHSLCYLPIYPKSVKSTSICTITLRTSMALPIGPTRQKGSHFFC